MPPSNVEVIRDHYEATNARDFDRVMAGYAEDVELVAPTWGIRGGTFKGRDAVGEWFGDWFRSFDRDLHFGMEEVTAVDDDRVLLVSSHHGRGRASGVEVHGTVVWLYTLRDGKIARVEGFDSREEALEATGS
jgi:ketosteroid isomerase-like protein